MNVENDDSQKFNLERSSLIPLVITLMTNNVDMFTLLWGHPMLWNDHKFLILLSNIVYETASPSLIRAFLLSDKTKALYNSISQREKEKFVQFTIFSLEQYFSDDSESSERSNIVPPDLDKSQLSEFKGQMEELLNFQLLVWPPYSLVNLTTNLLPLDSES